MVLLSRRTPRSSRSRNPRVEDQKLLRIRFDAAGQCGFGLDHRQGTRLAVDPSSDKTPTLGRKRSFFDELFGNIGTIWAPAASPAAAGPSPAKRDSSRLRRLPMA